MMFQHTQNSLLYLPTQTCFPIGGGRVKWHWTKLANSLGKQQLELLTRMWPGHAPWHRGKFVCQPESSKQFLSCCFLFLSWLAPKERVSFDSLGPVIKCLMITVWNSRKNFLDFFHWILPQQIKDLFTYIWITTVTWISYLKRSPDCAFSSSWNKI